MNPRRGKVRAWAVGQEIEYSNGQHATVRHVFGAVAVLECHTPADYEGRFWPVVGDPDDFACGVEASEADTDPDGPPVGGNPDAPDTFATMAEAIAFAVNVPQ